MKKMTHIIFGTGMGTFYLSIFAYKLYSQHTRHFLTHSPFSPLLIISSLGIGLLCSLVFSLLFSVQISVISYLICISHIALDSFNPSGIPILPKRRYFPRKPIKYDDKALNTIFILIGVVFMIFGVLISLSFLALI